MMTGYALSPDGLWRQHSWVLMFLQDHKPRLIETTVPRLAYFGYMRTADESLSIFEQVQDYSTPVERIESLQQ